MEIVSVDLMGKNEGCSTPEALRRSPDFRARQLRAKYSNLLAWHLASESRPMLGIQGEVVRTLTTKVAPRDGSAIEAFTTIIAHQVLDSMYGDHISWLRDDEFSPSGTNADRWLVLLASHLGAPLITNEGVTSDGISDRNKKGKNVRARAAEAGVPVYSPSQHLDDLGVDVDQLSLEFVEAVTDCLRSAVTSGAISGWAAPEAASRLADVYRFVMLDEVDDSIAGIMPPAIPWEL
ncbi:MAG: hypothetical protein ACE37F_26065 [Nannocystaceae bacterium]